MAPHTILFIAARPVGTEPRVLAEQARVVHAVQVELERAGRRDCLKFETRWDAEPLDLLREMVKLKPTVVHFCGDRVVGHAQLVAAEALAEAFDAAGSVKLVVLDACFSEEHAAAVAAHIDCVVVMAGEIVDGAAVSFAIGLYGGLGEGESVAGAFKQGRAAIRAAGAGRPDQAQLRVRPGVDASGLVLTEPRATTEPARSDKCRVAAHAAAHEAEDDDFLVSASDYYRDELAQHRHPYVARPQSGASEALEELTRWVTGPAGTFFVVSAPGGSGKTRLCIEVSRSSPLAWINLRTYRHDVEGLVRGLRRHMKPGQVYVYEDQQEFRAALGAVADAVFKTRARLIILSREQEGPHKAVRSLGGVRNRWLAAASNETLRKLVEVADCGSALPPSVRDRIVKIADGNFAVAVLALRHFRSHGTLERIGSISELFSSLYDDIEVRAGARWTAFRPLLGRLALARGLAPSYVSAYYDELQTILAPGQLTATECEVRLQPDQLNDHIADRVYFREGISPDFLVAIDDIAPVRAREIMTTLAILGRRDAARVLIKKAAGLDARTRIDLATAAHAGFHELDLIASLLPALHHDALATSDAHYCHEAAALLSVLGRWQPSQDLWQRAAELCADAGNGWGVSRVLEYLGNSYAALGYTAEARDAYARALQALEVEGTDPGLAMYGTGLVQIQLGILGRSRGDWTSSIAEFGKAFASFGRLATTRYRASGLAATCFQAGWTWLIAGNAHRAAHCFDQASSHSAEFGDLAAQAPAWVGHCAVLLQEGRFDDASRSFQRIQDTLSALGEVRLLADLRISYAYACAGAARWTDAMAQFAAALEATRGLGDKHMEARALEGQGETARRSGQHEAARVLYEQAIATYGASGMQYEQALLRCRLAAVLHSLHDDVRAFELNDQALHEFERIGDRNGQNVALVAKGSMHTARYEWEDATAAFDAALALCPDADITHQRASVLAAQARMFENLGSWRDAVAACREALCISLQLEHRSAAADAYAHIGSIRVCLGQHHEALAEYEAAIEQRPHVSSLYASRARVHYLWGSFDDAERDLAVAAQFDPASLRVVYARGWMMIRQRRYIEAVKLVDDHLVRHATDAELWNIRGYANLRSGESDAAVQDYERAQRLSPRSAVLYSTRGRACGHLGRFDEADRDFETAHALRPAMHELFWIEYEAAAVASLRGAPTSQLLDRLTRAMALPYWDGDCVCHSRMTEHLEWDPTFAALRHEARFEALLDDSVRRGIAATAFQIRSARSEDSDVTVSRNSGDFGAAVPPPAAYFHHRSK